MLHFQADLYCKMHSYLQDACNTLFIWLSYINFERNWLPYVSYIRSRTPATFKMEFFVAKFNDWKPGLKKFGACSYCAAYLLQTSFWGAGNIVHKYFVRTTSGNLIINLIRASLKLIGNSKAEEMSLITVG